ncbi:2-polyprenyl-6-methoxyphenol hydroxylase-like FAD-dependent oxidoreductase [Actinoalloteichus hoggarensis]|uniref:Pentachlorophenol 4-monooxygenase n=1 Tax=Actinoalloteichus hoggarensis TaxID=1470176 RepID=A0A221W3Y6_9PSEU|nr:FAD-dependent monooxygenase [Actinoalloteichus hoggarensis]ASO20393.1 Pentachlorophenol 4-monooxygenase [Actinoalloteichus hoggarensis]MBB5923431.1 2-polyprenyl-6-methoxyphenol hydroxylase-like FAD-dependent oxidoreductase [Actinoalloteichus hoggarensis]
MTTPVFTTETTAPEEPSAAPPHRAEVLIVGAGPAGLLLACELRLAGVETVLIERHHTRPDFCRGFTLNARALDLLARRGLAERLVAEGWSVPYAAFTGLPVRLDLPGTATDHPFTLGIPQTRVEEVLEARAEELGTDLRRGHALRTLDADADADAVLATVDTDHGSYRIEARYLVGCDGGRSIVRKQAGIDFPGTPATRHWLLGDVELDEPGTVDFGTTSGPGGEVFVIPRPDHVRVIIDDPRQGTARDAPVTLDLLSTAVSTALGRPVGLARPRGLTRFGDAARQAARYVDGRVLLAGDAAHVHPPAGALGVNIALDDAVNLGWKLAATVRGTAPAELLDTYHAERHAAGARVLAATRAQVLLDELGDAARDAERYAPLLDLFTRVASHPAGNRALTETVLGLDTSYDMPGDDADPHPWAGRMVPDLRLRGDDGEPFRPAALLAEGRGALLDLTGDGTLGSRATGFADRIETAAASCPDHPELRGLLLRPDGHAAWVETTTAATGDLDTALRRWFGAPAHSGG